MRLSFLPLASLALTISTSDVDPLATARRLADETFKNYTYGSSGENKVDCTQFLAAVVDDLARQCGVTLSKADRRTLLVVLGEEDANTLQTLVSASDTKIRGVQQALVSSNLGVAVEPKDAKPGDLIQYWYKKQGKWTGHSGLVERIEAGKATIYGSHNTTLQMDQRLPESARRGGIGVGPVFDLSDPGRRVFLVRWTKRTPD